MTQGAKYHQERSSIKLKNKGQELSEFFELHEKDLNNS